MRMPVKTNTVVPCIKVVFFHKREIQKRAAEAAKAEKAALKAAEEAAKAKKAAKPRVACSICAKLCTTDIAITNHVKACEKRKAAAATENYSSLPDFIHNYQFVTTRRPGQ